MAKDQAIGACMLLASLIGIVLYFWLVFISIWWDIIIKLTAFAAVGGILVIMAWIGWTMATTPPPKPLEFEETKPETVETVKTETPTPEKEETKEQSS